MLNILVNRLRGAGVAIRSGYHSLLQMGSPRFLFVADILYTLLLIVSGAILSLYPEKITDSFPLTPNKFDMVSIAFWIIAILAIVVYFAKEAYSNWQTDRLQTAAEFQRQKYEDQLKEYVKELKSMPPRDFLALSAENV